MGPVVLTLNGGSSSLKFAFAAALSGLDTLVFSGGIGENAPVIRGRICDGLDFLGITLDLSRNSAGDTIISEAGSAVTVCVLRTDEEIEIADAVCRMLRLGQA